MDLSEPWLVKSIAVSYLIYIPLWYLCSTVRYIFHNWCHPNWKYSIMKLNATLFFISIWIGKSFLKTGTFFFISFYCISTNNFILFCFDPFSIELKWNVELCILIRNRLYNDLCLDLLKSLAKLCSFLNSANYRIYIYVSTNIYQWIFKHLSAKKLHRL